MKAYLFDTETTGLISNHTVKLELQPSVIEYYGCLADLKTGNIEAEFNSFVKPPSPLLDKPNFGDKKTITQITGITNEMLENAPPFSDVAGQIRSDLESAPTIIAHNMSFDQEMIDIEFERLGSQLNWPARRLCTIEQTAHIKGYRLTLSALHEYLFKEPFSGAHRAKVDVAALLRCCVELHARDII